jgi:phage host-nuclease inhibitor protein Gam
MSRVFSNEQKMKLTQVINECCGVMNEVETLTGGMNDTIKAVAEELEIKPTVLKKAVKIAHKAALGQTNKDHEDLNEILETVGRTL